MCIGDCKAIDRDFALSLTMASNGAPVSALEFLGRRYNEECNLGPCVDLDANLGRYDLAKHLAKTYGNPFRRSGKQRYSVRERSREITLTLLEESL